MGATSDREQIYDLTVRYGRACDTRDYELAKTCFTEDGVGHWDQFGPVIEGHDALAAYLSNCLDRLDATQHLFTNYRFDLDGDRGHYSVGLHAQHIKQGAEDGAWCAVGGTYDVDVVRIGGEWKMTRMEFTPSWMTGNPEVLGHILDEDHSLA